MRIGIVAATFHEEIVREMLDAARERAEELDVEIADVREVYGSYDVPLPAQDLLRDDAIDGVVVVGAVITGETKHDEMIYASTVETLQRLSLEHDKPVTLGITGPGMTWDEAVERVDYAANAVEACVRLHKATG